MGGKVPLGCELFAELKHRHIDNELADDERRSLERHLQDCGLCRLELMAAQKQRCLLRAALRQRCQQSAPARLKSRWAEAMRSASDEDDDGDPRRLTRREVFALRAEGREHRRWDRMRVSGH